MDPKLIKVVSRAVGVGTGLLALLCAFFLFGFHFWQSAAIGFFVFLLFAFLAAILYAVLPRTS